MVKLINLRFNDEARRVLSGIKIRLADHSGDSVIDVIDPTQPVQVTMESFDRFMDDCIQQFGKPPCVWAGRKMPTSDDLTWRKFNRANADVELKDVAEMLVHYPLAPG